MNSATPYFFLLLAIFLGVTSNNFAKNAEGFTIWIPSIISGVTIILCMYALSNVMKVLPIGITYASFAGLTIIFTTVIGVIKFNQTLDFNTTIGLFFIIIGVLIVNLTNKFNI